jgi:hypothetical protein
MCSLILRALLALLFPISGAPPLAGFAKGGDFSKLNTAILGKRSQAWGTLALGVAFAAQSPSNSSGHQQSEHSSKDKNKKNHKKEDVLNAEVFSTTVANRLLQDLRDGLEGHSQRRVLSAFDADKMDDYLQFEDQIAAFFNKYESFRAYFRIVQSAAEGPKGVVLVDVQLEETPRADTSPPVRRNGQVRLELERGRKGWKIVDLNPRNFFS